MAALVRGNDSLCDLVEQAIFRADGALPNQLPNQAVEALSRSLKDRSDELRKNSIKAMEQIADPSAVPALTRQLEDTNVEIVMPVLQALEKIAHESVIWPLINALSSGFGEVRRSAATILGNLASPEKPLARELRREIYNSQVPSRLRVALETDPDVRVRRQAVIALGKIGSHSALPAILKAASDKDPQLRANAVSVLGTLGDRSEVPVVIRALNDGSTDVQTSAVEALGNLGDSSAVGELLKLLNPMEGQKLDYGQKQFNVKIIQALGKIGDNHAIPALQRAVTDNDSEISWAARTALSQINTPEAKKVLDSR
jgi:HEAT repeat protein